MGILKFRNSAIFERQNKVRLSLRSGNETSWDENVWGQQVKLHGFLTLEPNARE
jgi:hypothetical protein